MSHRTRASILVGVFLAARLAPVDHPTFRNAVLESVAMLHEYARDHVLLCLVPAFFIAGSIAVFVRQESVMRYLGPRARAVVAYPVAAVSGTVLAVCSCTVLPLFAGIHRRGAGLGPATAFLYSGPAINVLAIILTARVLGLELGVVRAVGAVTFAVVIGLLMHLLFREDERSRTEAARAAQTRFAPARRSAWQEALPIAAMVGVLVFANWGRPLSESHMLWRAIFEARWWITGAFLVAAVSASARWFQRDELRDWMASTWDFAQQILPLLFVGVLAAGFLLGRPGHEGVIPAHWVSRMVGGNSLRANLFASVSGALMYFATLTEVPILQGLMGAGMGHGPALALLLAGPALSLPNILVIRSVLGTRRTLAYVLLVVVLSTAAGIAYGAWHGAA